MLPRFFMVLLMFSSSLTIFVYSADDWSVPFIPEDPKKHFNLGKTEEARISTIERSWPAEIGAATVCLWKDDKLGAVSVGIDDNNWGDVKFWMDLGEQYGFRFTFFLITEPIEKGKVPSMYGTWEGWQTVLDAGHDVQGHSYAPGKPSDDRTEEEERESYRKTIELLETNLKDHRCLVLAYPWGKGTHKIAQEYFIAARGVDGRPSPAAKINYTGVAMGGRNIGQLQALLGQKVEKPKWLNNKKYIHGWIAPLFHSLGTKNPEKRKNAAKFIELLAQHDDQLWVELFAEVAKYGQQRDTAVLTTEAVETNVIKLQLSDSMLDVIFDVPLTVKVRVPDAWSEVSAHQAGVNCSAQLHKHESGLYAFIEAVPDRGLIIIQGK